MKLTEEQKAVVTATTQNGNRRVKVRGYAGAAKTTTMLATAAAKNIKGERGNAFFFNRNMAEEMRERIADRGISGLEASTLHSHAYRQMIRKYGNRLGKKLTGADLAQEFRLKPFSVPGMKKPITAAGLGWLCIKSLERYCNSDSEAMEPFHLTAGDHEITSHRKEVRAAVHEPAMRLYRELFEMQNKTWPVSHSVYLKEYVNEVVAGLRPGPVGDYLIGDEFQDSNGVTMALFEKMAQSQQIIIAGDPYQQIYQWRGSVDAMTRMDSSIDLELTQSFRFGQSIADLASDILGLLGASVRLKGRPGSNSMISMRPVRSQDEDEITGIICRSNHGVIQAAMQLMEDGVACYIPKASSLIDLILDMDDLSHGRPASRTELRIFKTFEEFMGSAEEEGGEHLTLLKIMKVYGANNVMAMLVRASDPQDARVILMTAHGAKGLQFPRVVLWSDFPDCEDLCKAGSPLEELRLLYVAATRAENVLDISGVSFLKELKQHPGSQKMENVRRWIGR